MRGFLDTVEDGVLSGWAFDDATKTSPLLTIDADGREIAQLTPAEHRADLVAAGIGNGHHGFTWTVPPEVRFSGRVMLTVRFARNKVPLNGGEVLINDLAVPKSELFGGILASGMWGIDGVVTGATNVVVAGWAIPPFGSPMDYTITRNGALPQVFERPERPDIARRAGLPQTDARFGFRCTFPPDPPAEGHAIREMAFVNELTGAQFHPHHSMHTASPFGPLPDAPRRRRVGGTDDLDGFLAVGATSYTRLDRVLQQYFGKGMAQADAILDWGCGCGRTFRFLPEERLPHFTGIDIDADNIAWCRTTYPAARFEAVDPRPPTVLGEASFDVVYAISVMTHLTEENHHEWLAELARITRPHAAVLLTIHGDTAWLNQGFPLRGFGEWKFRGFADVGQNYDLDAAVRDTSFYHNVFISRRYVFEQWSKYFRVLDVLPGAIFGHQDLVVMERRPPTASR